MKGGETWTRDCSGKSRVERRGQDGGYMHFWFLHRRRRKPPSPTNGFLRTHSSGTASIGAVGASSSPMPFIGDRWHRRLIAKPNTLDPCSCFALCGVSQRSSQPLQPRIRPLSAKPLSAAVFQEMSIRHVPSAVAA